MRRRVLGIAHRVRQGLRQHGFVVGGTKDSPIVPVVIGDQERMLRMWRMLFECGLFTNAVTQPAVPLVVNAAQASPMPVLAANKNPTPENKTPQDILPIKENLGTLSMKSSPLIAEATSQLQANQELIAIRSVHHAARKA